MIKKRAAIKALTCACAAFVLGTGCTAAFVNTAAHGIFPQQETNLTQQSNAAADYLVQQAQTYINRNRDLIIIEPLNDVDQPGMSSELSKMLPEQIGIRLSYLGYKTDLSRVATSADTNYLKPPASMGKPDFILSGTYKRRRIEMDVNVRVTDIHTRQVIAAFDYIVPLTREVNELATPAPKILRVTDQ